jgi:membrane protease YdiL (CAAX protease family)
MRATGKRSFANFLLLLFALSAPCWIHGSIYDVQIFPGLKLFQLPLGMPMVAALILVSIEKGKEGVIELLKRTYDFRNIRPWIWLLPILFIYPSIGLLNNWIQSISGIFIPSPHFSIVVLLGYSTVFFMTYAEELGLTGYAIDNLQQRYSALGSAIIVGLVWAGYHIPGFIISGYYSPGWIFWHALYTVASRVLFVWVYNNAGKSLFSMALFHWTFGLFWILWPQDNLQRAVPFYDPRICTIIVVIYTLLVVFLWGPKTLAKYRYAKSPE